MDPKRIQKLVSKSLSSAVCPVGLSLASQRRLLIFPVQVTTNCEGLGAVHEFADPLSTGLFHPIPTRLIS